MSHETLDRLISEPPKNLIIKFNGEDTIVKSSQLRREGESLINETKDLIQIFPIIQISIIYLKK
jgi:hypothetical protein